MNDEQRLRYSRHLLLPDLGEQGQELLLDSRVAIIGMGGLGSPAALYLAAAGVGELVLVDDDSVELSNLQRQVIHATAAIGQSKVESARKTLNTLNPDVLITTHAKRLTEAELLEVLKTVDVVLDCTDNFPSRFSINRAARQAGIPLVSAAAVKMQGQIAVFTPDSACYRCLYSDETATADTCAERGVLGPILGMLGSFQAMEALKLLTHVGDVLEGRLLRFDGQTSQWREQRLPIDPKCPVCGVAST